MRLPVLFAFAALVGLSACDSAKVSELTGAKPAATTQIAAACPPAATVAPACPPAQTPARPAMAPEAVKPAVPAPAAKPMVAHRIQAHAKARAWAERRRVKPVATVTRHRAASAPVRRYAYAGGYTGGPIVQDDAYAARRETRRYGHPPVYGRPGEAQGRQDYRYERSEGGYAQDGYAYERRDSGHAPYVDERRDDDRRAYGYERREGFVERSGSSATYEHRESGYSSGYASGGSVSSGGGYADDCNCRPQAAGRDRQGFLTWPGKR